jgi:hypothetical protein
MQPGSAAGDVKRNQGGVPGQERTTRFKLRLGAKQGQPRASAGPYACAGQVAVEVGFEPTHPRIFPDPVLEYAGRGGIPELGISCGHGNGRGPTRVKRLRRRGRRLRRLGRTGSTVQQRTATGLRRVADRAEDVEFVEREQLFDEQDLAEITSPGFPGERLITCRNPALAGERARKREDLLAATEKLLAPVIARVTAGRLAGAAAIGAKVGGPSTGTRWPSTLTSPSPTAASSSSGGRPRSTPRPGSTASTSSAPPSPKPTSTPPGS